MPLFRRIEGARLDLRLLDGTAYHETVLTLNNRPEAEGSRQVTAVPVTNGAGLAYPRLGRSQSPHGRQTLRRKAPDIDVENWPKDVIAGHDPQLERAVTEAMRQLKDKPVNRMTTEPAPPTWGKRKVPFGPVTAPATPSGGRP